MTTTPNPTQPRHRARVLTLLFCLIAVWVMNPAAALGEEIAWNRRIVRGPSARWAHAMAYDSARGTTVLFGGFSGLSLSGDTWEWDGTNWERRIAGGPLGRTSHAMAYDSARGVTVLFGGDNNVSQNAETWEWNGVSWTRRLVSGPSARAGHAMAYDQARRVCVLFGGSVNRGGGGETWEWDGSVWVRRLVFGPSPREFHAMAYDSARGVTVLYGGMGGTYDTWEWDGAAWTHRAVGGPTAANVHAMSYDAARGVTVLFGGSNGGYLDETWEWNGTAWTQRPIGGPSPRRYPALAYDAARGVTVLFGGLGESASDAGTWEMCSAAITLHPASQTICPRGAVTFSVIAAGSRPINHQWQWQPAGRGTAWVALTAGDNAEPGGTRVVSVADVDSANLVVRPLDEYSSFAPYAFRCVITNICGAVTSDEATLSLCAVDFNCDGFSDCHDYDAFVRCFETEDCVGGTADFNGDGFVDFFDYATFVESFEAGC